MNDALTGFRVIDLSVNAPGPYASKLLADFGAEVLSIVNPVQATPEYTGENEDPFLSIRGGENDALARGKQTLALNLKDPQDQTRLFAELKNSDVLISEMRPSKLEALGLGYDVLREHNPSLVLCQITGYGEQVPHAKRAGHDINYLAMSGALSLIKDQGGRPVLPQNILGDYAAGGTLGVTAILAALLRRERTGQGGRIVISMTDGIQYLMSDIAAVTMLAGHPVESWRGTLSGATPTYQVYRTKDDKWMAVGALEPKFIAILAEAIEWPELISLMLNKVDWDEASAGLASRFSRKTRQQWTDLLMPLDACVTPVLELDELTDAGLPDLQRVMMAGTKEQVSS